MENKEFYQDYINAFLQQNSRLNLVSKNDAKLLWEKHIFDSLSFEKFFEKYISCESCNNLKLLDIGTGGGFPAVPIALTYPQLDVFALDSIRKKIASIEEIKSTLNIKNLHPICNRAENMSEKYDIVTSRAVASLKIISSYALERLKPNGYFVAYKSKKAQEEINEAKTVLKKYNSKIIDIIEYQLPLEEIHTRNLIIIQKN